MLTMVLVSYLSKRRLYYVEEAPKSLVLQIPLPLQDRSAMRFSWLLAEFVLRPLRLERCFGSSLSA